MWTIAIAALGVLFFLSQQPIAPADGPALAVSEAPAPGAINPVTGHPFQPYPGSFEVYQAPQEPGYPKLFYAKVGGVLVAGPFNSPPTQSQAIAGWYGSQQNVGILS